MAARVSEVCASRLSLNDFLVYWSVGLLQWLQRDIAKSHLVLFEVLAQHVPQSFGLLRTEVDALLVMDGYFFWCLLLGRAKGQEEIPDADTNLDAIGVGFAIIGGLGQDNAGLLCGLVHGSRVTRKDCEWLALLPRYS